MAVSQYLIPQLQQAGQQFLQARQAQQKQQQDLQSILVKALIEQRMKQQDPIQNILNLGKVTEALQNMGIDPRSVIGRQMPQGIGQGQPKRLSQRPSLAPQQRQPQGAGQLQPTEYKQTAFGGLQPTKYERVKGLPGESAGKLTMINQALSDLESVEKMLFKKGRFQRGLAFGANIPGGRTPFIGRLIPDVGFGTQARQINSRINNALEAKLRIETGAAATQEEFDRLQTRFGITGFDTAQSAKDKIRRLKNFMRNAIVTIDPTGQFIYQTGNKKFDQELNFNENLDNQVNQFLDQLGAQ